jgi:hypothetical protein
MQPPKCRVCGKAEWGHVCGGTEKPEPIDPRYLKERARILQAEARGRPAVTMTRLSNDPAVARKPGRPANPKYADPDTGRYSHRLYLRDYMRKRRASKA